MVAPSLPLAHCLSVRELPEVVMPFVGVVGALHDAVLAAGGLVWAQARVDAARCEARGVAVGRVDPAVVPVEHHRRVLLHAAAAGGTFPCGELGVRLRGNGPSQLAIHHWRDRQGGGNEPLQNFVGHLVMK